MKSNSAANTAKGLMMTALQIGDSALSKKLFALATIAFVVSGSPALAKGCIKGAAVGAVGGHIVGKGHAVAGAAAGCVIGHHRAARRANAK